MKWDQISPDAWQVCKCHSSEVAYPSDSICVATLSKADSEDVCCIAPYFLPDIALPQLSAPLILLTASSRIPVDSLDEGLFVGSSMYLLPAQGSQGMSWDELETMRAKLHGLHSLLLENVRLWEP